MRLALPQGAKRKQRYSVLGTDDDPSSPAGARRAAASDDDEASVYDEAVYAEPAAGCAMMLSPSHAHFDRAGALNRESLSLQGVCGGGERAKPDG